MILACWYERPKLPVLVRGMRSCHSSEPTYSHERWLERQQACWRQHHTTKTAEERETQLHRRQRQAMETTEERETRLFQCKACYRAWRVARLLPVTETCLHRLFKLCSLDNLWCLQQIRLGLGLGLVAWDGQWFRTLHAIVFTTHSPQCFAFVWYTTLDQLGTANVTVLLYPTDPHYKTQHCDRLWQRWHKTTTR